MPAYLNLIGTLHPFLLSFLAKCCETDFSIIFPVLLSFSPSFQLTARAVRGRDGHPQQLWRRQAHPQALPAVRGLREPLAGPLPAPGARQLPPPPCPGPGPTEPGHQPAAVPPEGHDEVPVEAPLCLALPRARRRIPPEPAGKENTGFIELPVYQTSIPDL